MTVRFKAQFKKIGRTIFAFTENKMVIMPIPKGKQKIPTVSQREINKVINKYTGEPDSKLDFSKAKNQDKLLEIAKNNNLYEMNLEEDMANYISLVEEESIPAIMSLAVYNLLKEKENNETRNN